MKNPARKIVFLILSIICFFSVVLPVRPAQAATQFVKNYGDYSNTITEIFQKQETKNVTIFAKEQASLGSISDWTNGMIFNLLGPSPNNKGPLFSDAQNKGAVGQVADVMAMLYDNPPASTYAYVQDLMANAGFIPVKKAYAQGIGFTGLLPLLSLWKTSRDLAYGVIVIVMVIIGFMIIFRAKIDPKTVISIQAALPKIVLTLILITFSYPIAGFMIDLMYVVCGIVITLMAQAAGKAGVLPGAENITDASIQMTGFFTGGIGKLFGSVFNMGMIPAFVKQFILSSGINMAVGGVAIFVGILVAATGGIPALLAGGAIAGILVLIIGLGLLFTFIRLTMLLLNSYIQLLITVIIGPLLLLQEAIPGQSAFAQWIQNIIANLVVFPATIAVIYFSWIVTAVSMNGKLWPAPLTPTGGGSDSGNPMAAFLGMGIIFLAPSLVASIKKAFHPKPTIPVTAGTAFSPATGAASTVMGAGSQFYYMQQMLNGIKGQKHQ